MMPTSEMDMMIALITSHATREPLVAMEACMAMATYVANRRSIPAQQQARDMSVMAAPAPARVRVTSTSTYTSTASRDITERIHAMWKRVVMLAIETCPQPQRDATTTATTSTAATSAATTATATTASTDAVDATKPSDKKDIIVAAVLPPPVTPSDHYTRMQHLLKQASTLNAPMTHPTPSRACYQACLMLDTVHYHTLLSLASSHGDVTTLVYWLVEWAHRTVYVPFTATPELILCAWEHERLYNFAGM